MTVDEDLYSEIIAARTKLKIPEKQKKLHELQTQSEQQGFWDNNVKAQKVMQEISTIDRQQTPWQKIHDEVHDLIELLKSGDKTLVPELQEKLNLAKKDFEELRKTLKFSGPYDENSAIISLYSGAGGTDAQDWTAMLLRMYVRWAEKHNYNVKTIDQAAGDEAGIKTATIEIDGDFAYGKLKGEHGVHRLVRLSPFNADHLRQTSFAKVDVLPKIESHEDLELDDKDLRIDVYRSGGHGGQSVNTTDSAVRITHIPSGITVAIQNERSQLQNKETAMTVLRSRLAQLKIEQHKEKLSELKGPNQSAEWGNQIRSYVLHPYKQVKDLRTKFETSEPDDVLNGNLDDLIEAYLNQNIL